MLNGPDITGLKYKNVDFRDKFDLNRHSLCHLLGIYERSWESYSTLSFTLSTT